MPNPSAGAPPTPEELARSARVHDRLRSAAAPDGFLAFDRYVEICLYEPGLGYYTHPDLRRGRAGDYYTAPHVSPMFGATLARRVAEEFDRLGRPGSFRVVEVGSGDGTLAQDLAHAWSRLRPGASLDYALVERAIAPEPPTPSAAEGGVRLRSARSLADEGPLTGVVIAHELLDALPFRRLVRRDGAWRELGVAIGPSADRWAEGPLVVPVPEGAGSDVAEGADRAYSARTEGWIRELGDSLVAGAAIVVDFEAPRPGPGGSGGLEAVRSHRAVAEPLAWPGLVDLAAGVDFDRVRFVARSVGLREVAYRPQSEALGAWGFEEERERELDGADSPERRVRVALAAKNLLFGFDRFRVLELAAGPDRTARRPAEAWAFGPVRRAPP